jgi:two-component system nitrate/nitrite response regulator NarL
MREKQSEGSRGAWAPPSRAGSPQRVAAFAGMVRDSETLSACSGFAAVRADREPCAAAADVCAIALVSRDCLLRELLARMARRSQHLSVVCQAADGAELKASMRGRIDAVVIDPGAVAPGMGSWVRAVVRTAGERPVLALGLAEPASDALWLIEAGCRGFLRRDCAFEQLVSAIELLRRGEAVCPSDFVAAAFSRLSEYARRAELQRLKAEPLLSVRERQIADLIARGQGNKEIAAELSIHPQTVKNHVHRILSKLKIKNRVQVAQYIRNELF